jgi:hypothetical protein
MRSPLLASLFAILPAATLVAQSSVQVELWTDSAVSAIASDGTTTDFEMVPAKTQLVGAAGRVNLWPKVSNSGVSYASIPVLGYVNGVGTGANLLERGYCRGSKSVIGGTSSSTSKAGAVQGAHSYILKVIGAKGTAGSVYVNWHTKAVLGATVSGTVDIGNDNSVEFTGKANVAERKNFPMVLGSTPLEIKITLDAKVQGTGNYADYVNYFIDCFIGFTVDQTTTCTVTPYGQGCGPVLSGGSQLVGRPRGTADIRRHQAVGRPQALARQAVDLRSLPLRAIATHIAIPEVIGKDEDDVGLLCAHADRHQHAHQGQAEGSGDTVLKHDDFRSGYPSDTSSRCPLLTVRPESKPST